MPKKEDFILKDSPQSLIDAAAVAPSGRNYDPEYAKKPGAARIEDILLGTKLACVAITDDEPGTLAKVGTLNPWHIESLKIITGSVEEAHKPLSHILQQHFDLKVDTIINLTGWAGRHPIDTQGFIAHNDDIIVVSFRCTTSAMDWYTNFAVGSSEWEIDEDLEQGHSGWCSCFEGRFFSKKPRVHTGFYNNILKTIPIFENYVDPLLAFDQPPRKFYIVGHSLGAGLSTMATAFFLQKYDWKTLPHKLINISAGTPRSMQQDMVKIIEKQLAELRSLDKAVIFRVVMNDDMVPRLPPRKLGYYHVGKLVFLTEDGHVLIGPRFSDPHKFDEKEMKELWKNNAIAEASLSDASDDEKEESIEEGFKIETDGKAKSKYERKMAKIPRSIRDHCPDYYLTPLVKLYERENE